MWRALIRKRKGDQFRRRGREEDKITLRMFEKAIRNLIIFICLKLHITHISVCIYIYITIESSFTSLDLKL